LIDRGVNLNSVDKKGVTPTMWAKKLGKTVILNLLLESGATMPTERPR
jgi:ankyrin repeat protein